MAVSAPFHRREDSGPTGGMMRISTGHRGEEFSVLLVEDNPGDAFLLQEAVDNGRSPLFRFKHTATLTEAIEVLDATPNFDVMLVDLSLPDSFGIDTLQQIRAYAPTTPVVVLTGRDDDRLALDALQAGAEDYLTKGVVDGGTLTRVIRHAIERSQATRRIHELNTELRSTLDDRLGELSATQEQNIRHERLTALGTLAGGVAHELNNPLMGVINHIQYAIKKLGPEAQAIESSLSEALKYSRRCAEIVHDLLSFSRRGTIVHMPGGVVGDMNTAVREALRDARAATDAADIEVHLELAEAIAAVAIDESRLRQVILNVICNACQAMDGCEERRLVCRTVPGDRDATVYIGDTGPGMDEETSRKVFDMFYTTKAQGEGTGIGLALCHSLIDSVGGRIWVESVPGRGTVFAVTVPAAAGTTATHTSEDNPTAEYSPTAEESLTEH